MISTRICGGHLEIEFASGTGRAEDGSLIVDLEPTGRMWWDGEEVSEVVAEATVIAWCQAEGEDDEDDED